ncbi:variant leucine-rich repeat-containing protein [Bifidobacterium callitrichos]|uniref:variant leucine-rich repeat-containing protein n=1 Tax=Bifidobacterium callitrichos TaxID=762209 RepID=UPI00168B6AC9|nr:FHA domain-containing protein [Bifidobacterium callitrichos]
MSDHTTSQWRVKVSGGTQVGVRPGESLEIGRKPLRPLPDTGVARLEVEDSAKSMSKRHALLTVTAEGDALLRDLNSTNGSYVVNPDGELMRLPAGRDFPLPTSPIRLQFGDVPVDFVRVDKPEPAVKPFTPHVPNLFDYSSPTATHQEPDAADMSVADILDLRAGEPTAVFDAQSARPAAPLTPLKSLAGVGPEHDEPVQQAPSDASSSSASDDEPASDFHIDIDFPTIASGPVIAPASGDGDASDAGDVDAAAPTAESGVASVSTSETPSLSDQDDDHASDSMPLRLGDAHGGSAPRDLFADARGVEQTVEHAVEQSAETSETFTTQDNTMPLVNQVVNQNVVADNASTFEPEPGSVFEKVSNGDFDRPQPRIIEAGGYTSEDARHTTDMTKQFEMARHRELLPFLAMNPALYDDLYAWLAAQGNADIDEALAHNAGYQDYREAVGK